MKTVEKYIPAVLFIIQKIPYPLIVQRGSNLVEE